MAERRTRYKDHRSESDERGLRSITNSPKNLNHWQLIDDYKSGVSLWRLAHRYSITCNAVRRRLVGEGVTIREPSEQLMEINRRNKIEAAEVVKNIVEYMQKHRRAGEAQ